MYLISVKYVVVVCQTKKTIYAPFSIQIFLKVLFYVRVCRYNEIFLFTNNSEFSRFCVYCLCQMDKILIFLQVTEKDGLPKLICSSCVYKVISWVAFKTQCEQSDEILRTTFQCSEIETHLLSSSKKSGLDISQNCVEGENVDVNNLLECNNVAAKDDAADIKYQKSSEQNLAIENNWNVFSNASESEVQTERNERSIVYDEQNDAADEEEQEDEV